MAKKKTTKDYGSYDSYPLTDEQIRQAVLTFQFDFLEDMTDEKVGMFLALLRSFTYTTDHTKREGMLTAAENTLAPFTRECETILDKLAIGAHQEIIRGVVHNEATR